MIIMEFEVFYEFTPSISNPFPLEDEDIERNLRLLPNDLEHFLQDTKVVITKEDYENKRINIQIESEQSKELMRTSARQLMKLKQQAQEKESAEPSSFGVNNWDIEYEED